MASRAVKAMTSLVMGLLLLGFMVERAGPQNGSVVIHVTEPDVLITIDDWTERVEGWAGAPLSVDLPKGAHTLVMSRDGVELDRQEIMITVGGSLVVTTPMEGDLPEKGTE